MISRRELIGSAAALTTAGLTTGQTNATAPTNIVISSHNGLRACARAMELLKSGADTLDAVIAGVNINEEDPQDHTVGYGGLPNEEGVVELDASVMHGPTRRCGSVASIRNVKTPSKVAKAVMTETDHVMLVGDGATRFAREMGFPQVDLLTDDARLAWLVWKKSLRDPTGHTNWSSEVETGKPSAWLREAFPDADEATLAWAEHVALHPPTGTINCLSLNSKGEISGVTTTSGLAWKIPGRVGDSPIVGAGLYVDQEVGGAGSTGRGEENIRVAGGHTIVENMRRGMTPREACLDVLKRISHNFADDRARLALFDIRFYALRRDGQYAGASLWNREKPRFAVNDGGESRLEDCVTLLEA
jgi:N4-(beta-N-acetylglucosaminyl)-L-asparaginase